MYNDSSDNSHFMKMDSIILWDSFDFIQSLEDVN